jgi:hypothetical protein
MFSSSPITHIIKSIESLRFLNIWTDFTSQFRLTRRYLIMHKMFVCLFSWRYNPLWMYFHILVAAFSLLVFRGFLITHNDAPQSVELLWTSDQTVTETCTWQHTPLTTDKHPCPRWDSNPKSQQASGRRPALRPRGHWDRQCIKIVQIFCREASNVTVIKHKSGVVCSITEPHTQNARWLVVGT